LSVLQPIAWPLHLLHYSICIYKSLAEISMGTHKHVYRLKCIVTRRSNLNSGFTQSVLTIALQYTGLSQDPFFATAYNSNAQHDEVWFMLLNDDDPNAGMRCSSSITQCTSWAIKTQLSNQVKTVWFEYTFIIKEQSLNYFLLCFEIYGMWAYNCI